MLLAMKETGIKKTVKKHYSDIAENVKNCSCAQRKTSEELALKIGYSQQDITSFSEANLGLGCGNPTALGDLREGNVVLDLGSGAGFDCFLAARKVGPSGKVIGVDMTAEMVEKARNNAYTYGFTNVEFRHGDIENLPIDSDSIDVVISNCVINLAPDKFQVFKEAYRVLKPGGRLFVSDIVLLAELTEAQRNDPELIAGCVGGAVLKDEYLSLCKKAGFSVTILDEDIDITKTQYQDIALESLKLQAEK